MYCFYQFSTMNDKIYLINVNETFIKILFEFRKGKRKKTTCFFQQVVVNNLEKQTYTKYKFIGPAVKISCFAGNFNAIAKFAEASFVFNIQC